MEFTSRRSPVLCTHGCAASSQPLASEIGLRVLRAGGNAADACVAMAAALNVAEPCMTGIGGDAFCLFFDAKSKSVRGLNGSGLLALLREDRLGELGVSLAQRRRVLGPRLARLADGGGEQVHAVSAAGG